MAGLAGGMKATVFQFATLTDVSWPVSGEVILMTLLGGLGTLTGPMVGAGIVIVLNDYLAGFGEWSLIAQGAIMLLVIIFLRRGVVGELGAYLNRIRAREKTESQPPRPACALIAPAASSIHPYAGTASMRTSALPSSTNAGSPNRRSLRDAPFRHD